jgi:sugar O-acyltransferase (sialic acid O-acetyltransferase NeuD family)
MRNVVIYGGGGYGKEVACLIRAINNVQASWNFIGFIDDGIPVGTSNVYGKVLGGIEYLHNIKEQLDVVLAIGNPGIQSLISKKILNPNIRFPNIVAPDVLFLDSDTFSIGLGNIIGFRSIISCFVNFGNFNLLNSDVFIGHETIVGNFNMFNPSVRISGQVTIGNTNFFGVCSIVLQNKKIGDNTTISANSVVIRNTASNCLYHGNPAIKMRF